MKILFTFTGYYDPFSDNNVYGPVMAAHSELKPELTVIFTTGQKESSFRNSAFKCKEEMEDERYLRRHSFKGETRVVDLSIANPANHNQILSELRRYFLDNKATFTNPDYYMLLTPGTSHMHSCWLLLAASGEIPATLLQTNKPNEGERLEVINHQSENFPKIHVDFSHLDNIRPERDGLTNYLSSKNIAGNERIYKELKLERIAQTGYPVLIHGETGSGKENLAIAVHDFSNRKGQPFIAVNCGAIPENLAESELFGHEKGAFTGADQTRKGKIEMANKGTLFLDEIGDLSMSNQVKLLRFLQEGTITRVGNSKEIKLNVRIVAASHKNLLQQVQEGNFREDLYYRLSAFTLNLPPLRARTESEFSAIANALIEQISNKIGKSSGRSYRKTLEDSALSKLFKDYTYPGNIRELENILVKSCLTSEGSSISAPDIELPLLTDNSPIYPDPLKGFDMKVWEKEMKRRIYQTAYDIGGGYAQAGKLLNVSTPGVRQYLMQNEKK